jgi:hypothetical protein
MVDVDFTTLTLKEDGNCIVKKVSITSFSGEYEVGGFAINPEDFEFTNIVTIEDNIHPQPSFEPEENSPPVIEIKAVKEEDMVWKFIVVGQVSGNEVPDDTVLESHPQKPVDLVFTGTPI